MRLGLCWAHDPAMPSPQSPDLYLDAAPAAGTATRRVPRRLAWLLAACVLLAASATAWLEHRQTQAQSARVAAVVALSEQSVRAWRWAMATSNEEAQGEREAWRREHMAGRSLLTTLPAPPAAVRSYLSLADTSAQPTSSPEQARPRALAMAAQAALRAVHAEAVATPARQASLLSPVSMLALLGLAGLWWALTARKAVPVAGPGVPAPDNTTGQATQIAAAPAPEATAPAPEHIAPNAGPPGLRWLLVHGVPGDVLAAQALLPWHQSEQGVQALLGLQGLGALDSAPAAPVLAVHLTGPLPVGRRPEALDTAIAALVAALRARKSVSGADGPRLALWLDASTLAEWPAIHPAPAWREALKAAGIGLGILGLGQGGASLSVLARWRPDQCSLHAPWLLQRAPEVQALTVNAVHDLAAQLGMQVHADSASPADLPALQALGLRAWSITSRAKPAPGSACPGRCSS
jgi:hypothetical protein